MVSSTSSGNHFMHVSWTRTNWTISTNYRKELGMKQHGQWVLGQTKRIISKYFACNCQQLALYVFEDTLKTCQCQDILFNVSNVRVCLELSLTYTSP